MQAPWYSVRGSPADWPQKGTVRFVGYSTRYRSGLDLVLKNITLTVDAGTRVGVVGRTGAGVFIQAFRHAFVMAHKLQERVH